MIISHTHTHTLDLYLDLTNGGFPFMYVCCFFFRNQSGSFTCGSLKRVTYILQPLWFVYVVPRVFRGMCAFFLGRKKHICVCGPKSVILESVYTSPKV